MGVFISCLSGRALGGLAYISLGMLFRNYLNDLNMGGVLYYICIYCLKCNIILL